MAKKNFKNGKRYDWIEVFRFIKGEMDKGVKDEDITKELEKRLGKKAWVPKLVDDFVRKCLNAKTVKEFRDAFGAPSQADDAMREFMPELAKQLPPPEEKKEEPEAEKEKMPKRWDESKKNKEEDTVTNRLNGQKKKIVQKEGRIVLEDVEQQ